MKTKQEFRNRYLLLPLCVCGICFFFFSCNKEEKTGRVNMNFSFSVGEQELQSHQLQYTNAAGNVYQVDEVKYFISDIQLFRSTGKIFTISDHNSVYYVDRDISSTLQWNVGDLLPVGKYDSIRFIVGLSASRNVSHAFPNPPECNMAWPDSMGGGYHYMQINGKWNAPDGLTPFSIHTGISISKDSVSSLERLYHHCFTVTLPMQLTVSEKNTNTITLNMDINQWFNDPVIFDFDVWGGSIMNNLPAQLILKQNGKNVFSVK
ncbi:MAG: hypothetical protein LBR51_07630 [Bacteroidales bacterium]|jgi:hypothetical protein|nr:hypothetical protein [Bacteroidales bacterium]